MSKKEEREKKHRWKLVGRIFQISPRHIQMAKLLGANPQTTFDNWRERAKERGISLAVYIERRYTASFGRADPMKCQSQAPRKSKRQRLAARGEAKLTLTLPAKLVKRMESQCESAGCKLAEVIQSLLEERFPASGGTAPTEGEAA